MPWTNTNECEEGTVCTNNVCAYPGEVPEKTNIVSKFSEATFENEDQQYFETFESGEDYNNTTAQNLLAEDMTSEDELKAILEAEEEGEGLGLGYVIPIAIGGCILIMGIICLVVYIRKKR